MTAQTFADFETHARAQGFDVVLVHGVSKADDSPTLEWLQSAFDAS